MTAFWWQTRFNLLRWFPEWRAPVVTIDYLTPFIYLSDILFIAVLIVWFITIDWKALRAVCVRSINTLDRYGLALQPLVWLFLLLTIAAISIWLNNAGAWAWYRWLKVVEGGLLGVWVAVRWREPGRRMLYSGILLVGLGLESVMMIGEWFKQASLGWQWLGEWLFTVKTPGIAKIMVDGRPFLRPMATFAHPNIAAAILVTSLPLAAWWWKAAEGRYAWPAHDHRLVWLGRGWLLVILIALFVSFSRSAWLISVILLGVGAVWAWSPKLVVRAVPRLAWSKLAVLPSAIVLSWLAGPLALGRFEALATTDRWSWGLRRELEDVAWALWQSHPWLGVGLNSFTLHVPTVFYGLVRWQQPVHNVWLLALSELGGLGLLALSGLFLSTVSWLALVVWRRNVTFGIAVIGTVWMSVLALSFIDHYWWTSQQAYLAVSGLVGGTLLLKRYLYGGQQALKV